MIVIVIQLVFAAVVLKTLYNIIRAAFLRFSFYQKLKKTADLKGWHLKKNRLLFSSFIKVGKRCDLILKTNRETHYISFITSLARKRFLYFINSDEYIRYAKLAYVLPFAKRVSSMRFLETLHKTPKAECHEGAKPILLFNPAPLEIAYLSNEKQEIVTNGSTLFSFTAYDAKTYLTFLKEQ